MVWRVRSSSASNSEGSCRSILLVIRSWHVSLRDKARTADAEEDEAGVADIRHALRRVRRNSGSLSASRGPQVQASRRPVRRSRPVGGSKNVASLLPPRREAGSDRNYIERSERIKPDIESPTQEVHLRCAPQVAAWSKR